MTAFACIKAAHDAGINYFDTAENYNAGQAEVVLGRAIKHFGWKQNDLVISTMVSFVHRKPTKYSATDFLPLKSFILVKITLLILPTRSTTWGYQESISLKA